VPKLKCIEFRDGDNLRRNQPLVYIKIICTLIIGGGISITAVRIKNRIVALKPWSCCSAAIGINSFPARRGKSGGTIEFFLKYYGVDRLIGKEEFKLNVVLLLKIERVIGTGKRLSRCFSALEEKEKKRIHCINIIKRAYCILYNE
jgi:hypothetical protein